MRNAPVSPIGMDLLLFEFCSLSRGGVDNHATRGIDLDGHLKSALFGVAEEFHEHFDDVFIRMVVVVPQNDMVPRNVAAASFLFLLDFLFGERYLNACHWLVTLTIDEEDTWCVSNMKGQKYKKSKFKTQC